jgi:integrase
LGKVGNEFFEVEKMKRIKTDYKGVYYREVERLGGNGLERMYYIVFKQEGKVFEEKVGGQYRDQMTPARAAKVRADRIEGRRQSRQEIRQAKVEAKEAEANKWTLDKIWERYLAMKPDLKGMTTDLNRYEKHLRPLFGCKEPKDLTPFDVDRLRVNLKKTHTAKTAANVLELLRRLLNFAIKKQICETPSFPIELPRVNNLVTEDLTTDQLARLLEIIEEEFYFNPAAQIMKLALITGMRRGELFRLQWDDIDFGRGFIHIRGPKGGVDQKIPLNDSARQTLEAIPREKSPYVFPGRGGGERVDMGKSANRIKALVGLPKSFRPLHGLRHTYASMLASSGQVDLYTLQKLLTHKSAAMTQRYAHLRDDALAAAAGLASHLIQQSLNEKRNNNDVVVIAGKT